MMRRLQVYKERDRDQDERDQDERREGERGEGEREQEGARVSIASSQTVSVSEKTKISTQA